MPIANGPWQTRVSFAPDSSFAYRPGEVIFRRIDYQRAIKLLSVLAKQDGRSVDYRKEPDELRIHPESSFVRVEGVSNTLEAIKKLNQSGVYAQPNHVLFAHTQQGLGNDALQANPFYANPFYANPFYANPFYANPFYANPFYANPFYANPSPNAYPAIRETGRRPSSARPAKKPPQVRRPGKGSSGIRVVILDTGFAEATFFEESLKPRHLAEASVHEDKPDSDGMGYLDPVAGHGTFIAGIIEQYAPGCTIEVLKVLEPYGDSAEGTVSAALHELANRGEESMPHLINLSFGGYSSTGMEVLAEAITRLHHKGSTVVASAGNDATSRPMYPAVLPHVVAVGALDHEGVPAPFTNYGPWVRTCALGVEIVSSFFRFRGDHPSQRRFDIDNFDGWAVWSGTSFAAPLVVAALANEMRKGNPSHDAVRLVIEPEPNSDADRKVLLGKVVDPFNLLHPEE